MHHNHDALLSKLSPAQIANQNRHTLFNDSVFAPPLKREQQSGRVVRFTATVLLINPVASTKFRHIVALVRDCFKLAWQTYVQIGGEFIYRAYIDGKKRTYWRIVQFEDS